VVLAHFLGHRTGPMKAILANQQTLILLGASGSTRAVCPLRLPGAPGASPRDPILMPLTGAGDWASWLSFSCRRHRGVHGPLHALGFPWYSTRGPLPPLLLVFDPQIGFVRLPPGVQAPRGGAFLIVALLPFTKLVHLLFLRSLFSGTRPFCTAGVSKDRGMMDRSNAKKVRPAVTRE